MTKKELASKIAKQFGITQLLALEAVQMVFDGIIETLLVEGRIELRGSSRSRGGEPGRHATLVPEKVCPCRRRELSPSSQDGRWSKESTN